MKLGTVTGSVWATKKCPALTGQILLRVRSEGTELIAADLVGAGEGEHVILSFGSAARLGLESVPVDAAIIGILDDSGGSGYVSR